MRNQLKICLLSLALAISTLAKPSFAQYKPDLGGTFPWSGERLEYSLYFNTIEAMRATVKTGRKKTSKYGPYIPMEGTAQSVGFFDQVYGVDDIARTYVDPKTLRPFFSHKTFKEAGNIRTYRVDYQTSSYVAHVYKTEPKKTLEFAYYIPKNTHDLLSWIPLLRSNRPSPGDRHQFHIYDGWSLSRVRVKVVSKESLYLNMGWFKTWKLKFRRDIIDSGRISRENPDKPVKLKVKTKNKHTGHLWISRDERHIPVQLAISTKFGDIRVELTHYRPPTND